MPKTPTRDDNHRAPPHEREAHREDSRNPAHERVTPHRDQQHPDPEPGQGTQGQVGSVQDPSRQNAPGLSGTQPGQTINPAHHQPPSIDTPQRADPPRRQPGDPEPEPRDKPSVKPEEVESLLRAGTKLVPKGQDPKNWITITRIGDDLAIAVAATDAAIADLIKREFVLAD
jgi:hypothetical protein